MRILRRAAATLLAALAFLPLTGCLGLLIGLQWGETGGRLQGRFDERRKDDVERWVTAATLAERVEDRRAAIRTLRRMYRAPADRDPADIRRQTDARLVRIAEWLEDTDAETAKEARALVADIVGRTVSFADADRKALEAMTGQRDMRTLSAGDGEVRVAASAYAEATQAALRAYGLARLGYDLRCALPLLRRGLAFEPPSCVADGADGALPLRCAMALHAIDATIVDTVPVLLAHLPAEDGNYRSRARLDAAAVDAALALDAAIGLGQLGAPAEPALAALRRLEGNADLPLRHAAALARDRIGAAIGQPVSRVARPPDRMDRR